MLIDSLSVRTECRFNRAAERSCVDSGSQLDNRTRHSCASSAPCLNGLPRVSTNAYWPSLVRSPTEYRVCPPVCRRDRVGRCIGGGETPAAGAVRTAAKRCHIH
eukprot:39484-Prymnesium_polylepis.1